MTSYHSCVSRLATLYTILAFVILPIQNPLPCKCTSLINTSSGYCSNVMLSVTLALIVLFTIVPIHTLASFTYPDLFLSYKSPSNMLCVLMCSFIFFLHWNISYRRDFHLPNLLIYVTARILSMNMLEIWYVFEWMNKLLSTSSNQILREYSNVSKINTNVSWIIYLILFTYVVKHLQFIFFFSHI